MSCGGVTACHRCGMCTVWYVCGTQDSEQYTYHTYDMLTHHRITYNDVVLLPSFNLNITSARL